MTNPARYSVIIFAVLAVGIPLIIAFDRYECWFETLCGGCSDLKLVNPSIVYVNQDTLTYLTPPSGHALRPPLYYLFGKLSFASAATLTSETYEILKFERALGPDGYQELAGLVEYLKIASGTVVHLRFISWLQQLALLAAVLGFVAASLRYGIVAGALVAITVLLMYGGGILNHWYFSHAIESKFLYLACFFAAAAAALSSMRNPTIRSVIWTTLFAAAMALTRPQGILACALVLVVAARYFLAEWPSIKMRAKMVAGGCLVGFSLLAFFPTLVTLATNRVLQPSNIYAMQRMAPALEVAKADDIAQMPSELTRSYLAEMLARRDTADKPKSMLASVHRNQKISMTVCDEIARREIAQSPSRNNLDRLNLMCAQEMMDISDVIFREHYSEYLSKIILPNLTKLLAEHVGGAIWSVPFSIILATGLVMAMLFIDPWVAAWGAAITAMHLGLVTILAMMVGPYSYYFLTSEPVFFASLALMTGMALTSFHHTTVSQRR